MELQTAIPDPAPDPSPFADELLAHLEPHRQAVPQCAMIQGMRRGTCPLGVIRAWTAQYYEYVSSVTSWFGLMLRKLDDKACRDDLLANMAAERGQDHPGLWLQLTRGWGIPDDEVLATELCPEMQALNDYLWRVCLDGHVIEAGAALNVALEGISKDLVSTIWPGLHAHYDGRNGVSLDGFALSWLETHARVDPGHSQAALTLVNRYGTTPDLRARAKFAARRALQYLQLGMDGCYRRYGGDPDVAG